MMTSTPTQLVINWHLTEACNYHCRYCYAKWQTEDKQQTVITSPAQRQQLLKELAHFFHPNNQRNPLAKKMLWSSVRLNFAGGEPLLYDRWLPDTAYQATALGMDVSLISNGSRFNSTQFRKLIPHLSMLGISIDSVDALVNRAIGREDRKGASLDIALLYQHLTLARKQNPSIRIKINTVVNALNQHEDMHNLITTLSPDKWKVLKMLPVVNSELSITETAYQAFIDRHRSLSSILYPESGLDMRESYLMVDPYGRFYQNRSSGYGNGYIYSQPILIVGAEEAFEQLTFNSKRFLNRYSPLDVRIEA